MSVSVLHGDSRELLKGLADNSIDSVVCDPPYALTSINKRFSKVGRTPSTMPRSGPHARASAGFMGQKWDTGETAFDPEFWAEVLRVLKPGGYCIAFSSSRTGHWLACAMELAGFVMHPMFGWIFGSGFPKAHDAAKAIARVGEPEAAERWQGWAYGGQATKPALEPIYVGQKPFSEKNGALNILKWGTGALNIDGCRVGMSEDDRKKVNAATWRNSNSPIYGSFATDGTDKAIQAHEAGRWPANVCTDGSAEVLEAFPDADGAVSNGKRGVKGIAHEGFGAMEQAPSFADSGSAARFFYSAKAGPYDRFASKHPTVKPVELMRWLCRLVTPPGGTVLDPFAGSGTTGAAAMVEGFDAILMEREAAFVADIERRIAWMKGDGPLTEQTLAPKQADDIGPLFELSEAAGV